MQTQANKQIKANQSQPWKATKPIKAYNTIKRTKPTTLKNTTYNNQNNKQ